MNAPGTYSDLYKEVVSLLGEKRFEEALLIFDELNKLTPVILCSLK